MTEISALLIDSGNGWFSTKKPEYKIFSKPDFSDYSYRQRLTRQTENEQNSFEADPIEELQDNLRKGYTAIGYIGYDYVSPGTDRRSFRTDENKEETGIPETYFHYFSNSADKEGDSRDLNNLVEGGYNPVSGDEIGITSNLSREKYLKIVSRAREYIADGDIYQVNLSQKFYTAPLTNVPGYSLELYKNQPVPYFAYINFGTFQLISGSMELFLGKYGNQIISQPIKGTIKRSLDKNTDKALKESLRDNPKERAENVMIVDLMRNDLGRICKYGTIKVPRLFDVKPFSTLYQMESEIRGVLRDNVTLKDIIDSTFPPGSVTGAPKSRCLEIIDELEPHKRGPYCGAIGIFYPDGNFILSVAIRILVNMPDKSIYWMGGGIVWDSDPQKEYEETLLKAKAISKTRKIR